MQVWLSTSIIGTLRFCRAAICNWSELVLLAWMKYFQYIVTSVGIVLKVDTFRITVTVEFREVILNIQNWCGSLIHGRVRIMLLCVPAVSSASVLNQPDWMAEGRRSGCPITLPTDWPDRCVASIVFRRLTVEIRRCNYFDFPFSRL